MPRNLLTCGAKCEVQSNVSTTVVPSSPMMSWEKLHLAELSATCAMACMLPTSVLRNKRLSRPKHQSGENCVANDKKRKKNVRMSSSHDTPGQILQHAIVLILACTVVGMQEHLFFAQAVVSVQLADYGVCPLPHLG